MESKLIAVIDGLKPAFAGLKRRFWPGLLILILIARLPEQLNVERLIEAETCIHYGEIY